jgi:transcription initiation factor IIE alpha subunit
MVVLRETKSMKPMVLTSTQFISYREIRVKDTDLYEDAWGLSSDYADVIEALRHLKAFPRKKLTDRLIDRIRKED